MRRRYASGWNTRCAGLFPSAIASFGRFGIRVQRSSQTTAPATARSCTRSPAGCSGSASPHSPLPAADEGKAERFIRTLLGGWPYGAVYRTSSERVAALAGWLDWYNRLRPQPSLGRKPALTRLAEMNNAVGTNI